jgi:hypothetical protein
MTGEAQACRHRSGTHRRKKGHISQASKNMCQTVKDEEGRKEEEGDY